MSIHAIKKRAAGLSKVKSIALKLVDFTLDKPAGLFVTLEGEPGFGYLVGVREFGVSGVM